MVKAVGVKFKHAGKIYYFDPAGIDVNIGDKVIVETAKGLEFATVVMGEEKIHPEKIVSPLKPIIRIATEADKKRNEENNSKKAEAIRLCQEKIDKHKLEMKLVDVEYTFDNSKVIFYFTADGRVDFRELVKDLASVFRMRIELRQIGVRDEAKMMGGIGNCGRPLCCHQWLSEFQPVSIKMAKTQGLSLNPTKISGICGRLMCCLKYENDTYAEAKNGMPDNGEKIKTAEGILRVCEVDVLSNVIKARKIVKDMDTHEEQLSDEVFTYGKEEVKRLGKKRGGNKVKEEEMSEEMKELLKD